LYEFIGSNVIKAPITLSNFSSNLFDNSLVKQVWWKVVEKVWQASCQRSLICKSEQSGNSDYGVAFSKHYSGVSLEIIINGIIWL